MNDQFAESSDAFDQLAATAPAAPAPAADQEIPEAVLKIPAMQALLKGSINAISALRGGASARDPELKAVLNAAPQLADAGFSFYRGKTRDVISNSLKLDPSVIETADKADLLDDVAAPWEHLKAIDLSGARVEPVAAVAAPVVAPAPAVAAPVVVESTGANTAATTAGAQNQMARSPADQVRPGAGAVANLLVKRPV